MESENVTNMGQSDVNSISSSTVGVAKPNVQKT